MQAIDKGTDLPPLWLDAVQREDGLFPLLSGTEWASPPPSSN